MIHERRLGRVEFDIDRRPDHEHLSDTPDPWRWRVKDGEGNIVLSKSGYSSQEEARVSFRDIMRVAVDAVLREF